jgi:DNA-binding NarL/FixJ family response regulator
VFTRKLLSATATDTKAVLVSTDGTRLPLELSAVSLMNGERVVGVFGLISGPLDEEPTPPHPALTPRQTEVLRLLEQGHSTKQIAQELHLSPETVRNHIRHLFRALGVHSRIEAVVIARHGTA